MNGESVASHVTVSALVLALVLVDLRAVRSALATILNLNHAMNHVNRVILIFWVHHRDFQKKIANFDVGLFFECMLTQKDASILLKASFHFSFLLD